MQKWNTYSLFSGSLDNNPLPNGHGLLQARDKSMHEGLSCIKLAPGLKSIEGKFVHGIPQGIGIVYYSDGALIKENLIDGAFYGPCKAFGPATQYTMQMQYFGNLNGGKPHGPIWFFPNHLTKEGSVLIYFINGTKLDNGKNRLHTTAFEPNFNW